MLLRYGGVTKQPIAIRASFFRFEPRPITFVERKFAISRGLQRYAHHLANWNVVSVVRAHNQRVQVS